MRVERSIGPKLWLLLFIAVSMMLSGCAVVKVNLFQRARPLKEKVIEGKGPGKVLLLNISGILTYRGKVRGGALKEHVGLIARVKEELRLAAGDPEIKAVVLRIYSPGGTVSACDLLHHELQSFKKQKRVKIVACLLGLATSGAYYVATPADYIFAQPTTLTGSIGTMAFKFDLQGLLHKVGIEQETVKSGDKKDMWSPLRPATKEEREILQGIIREYQENFLEVIRRARPQVTAADLAIIGDGRVLTGRQAVKLHLVDRLGYLSEAVRWAKENSGQPSARLVMYHRPGTYVENIYSICCQRQRDWQGSLGMQGQLPEPMYLWLP